MHGTTNGNHPGLKQATGYQAVAESRGKAVTWNGRIRSLLLFLCLGFLWLGIPGVGVARDNPKPTAKRTSAALRPADIELVNKTIGSTDAQALIRDTIAYVNPLDVFNFIHVHTTLSSNEDILSGFYIDEKRTFIINSAERSITFEGHRYAIGDSEFAGGSTGTYLATSVLERVFKLKCAFDLRKLQVAISSGEKLPAEREFEDEKRRNNAQGLTKTLYRKPDRVFTLPRSWFSLGILDWSFGAFYSKSSESGNYHLQLGSQFAGGDLDASLDGNYNETIDWARTPWRWRLPVQNSSLLKTILVGRRAPFSNLQLADSMVGIQFSNTQSSMSGPDQSTYTNYTIADRTEPDWTVELYLNEQLITYVKADQTGYYKFVFPLPYGSTDVRLRFLGPYGEVRTKELAFRIPYTFLHPGEVQYELTAGTSVANPELSNSVAKLDLKLGISSAITLGGGVRYSMDPIGKPVFLPSASGSLRISSDVVASADYYHKAGIQSSLNVTSPLGFALDAQYQSSLGWQASALDNLVLQNRRSLNVFFPLPWNIGTVQLGGTDIPINSREGDVQASGTFNLNLFGYDLSSSASVSYHRDGFHLKPTSEIQLQGGLMFSLPPVLGVQFRPSANVDYTHLRVLDASLSATKYIGDQRSVSLSGVHDFRSRSNSIQASIGFNFPFAQTGLQSTYGTGSPLSAGTTMQGSVVLDPGAGNILFENHSAVRTGGVTIEPFLDQNNNGRRDAGEPIVKKVEIEAPGTVDNQKDWSLRIMDLEPYVPYYFKTSMKAVESASFVSKYESFEITPPANGFARVQLPILSVGQIEGYVSMAKSTGQKPMGGVRIKIQHADANDTSMVMPTEDLLTYSNGEYFYLGLMPGKYRVSLDPKQLELLHGVATPPYIEFKIENKDDGDLIERLDFSISAPPEGNTTKTPK
ncbi:MAG: hypothetical protein Q8922_12085 [Bacteroidota bacterium]|nr:hypothetical protein [Bacteroidota bacterium]MDP4233321.1 hypothetical protein [Bacteroidota bacterium]MDP4242059.1 hypothetical protein [Bacteroidota bacterium]MDP4288663.1 hypothetical protein [Bacteroidota bacterium]